jgi:hypothetical protein
MERKVMWAITGLYGGLLLGSRHIKNFETHIGTMNFFGFAFWLLVPDTA